MKNKIIPTILFLFVFCGCSEGDNKNSNRVYFTIDLEDRKVVLPVKVNDSIVANLAFDSGGGLAARRPLLDESILATHPFLFTGIIPDTTKFGSSWGTELLPALQYKGKQSLTIGTTKLGYNGICVTNWKKLMNSDLSDGMFNIPIHDSIYVWELNFEQYYMEIHQAESFVMPENTHILPFVNTGADTPFYIQLPLHIECPDGDTLTLHRTFFIDTGMSWDIVVKPPAEELDFFNKRDDAVWTRFLNKYHRHYTVNATLFDNFAVDSVRIYTFDYQDDVHSSYLIGLNFLKRFNVFFDMKNRQLGLQPINNFQRLANPLHKRFHYSTTKTSDGRYVINKMADYRENYYKEAGLQEGDEVVEVNGVLYGSITPELADQFKKQEYAVFDIIRNGKPMKIPVRINHNEIQGD